MEVRNERSFVNEMNTWNGGEIRSSDGRSVGDTEPPFDITILLPFESVYNLIV